MKPETSAFDRPAPPPHERTVTLLGATGSIGASTVDLLKHQRELGEPETQAVRRTRNEDAKPPEVSRLAQTCRRKAWILFAKYARHLRSGRHDEFGGAVAQQSLLRCQMQIHDRLLCSPSAWEVQHAAGEDVALDF